MEQASEKPEAMAVVGEESTLSYGELNRLSNRLAHTLRHYGCRRGDRVGLLMPKSPVTVAAMMGILKADGIYVPLDVDSPPERLRKIIRKSEPAVILVSGNGGSLTGSLEETLNGRKKPAIGRLEDEAAPGRGAPPEFPPAFTMDEVMSAPPGDPAFRARSSDPAHLLFTSGSTGQPKGVITTHENDMAFVDWATGYFGIERGDRLSGHPPFHFDMSTLDIYGTLSTGSTLYLVPRDCNVVPGKLTDFIRRNKLTQWFSVPTVLSYLARFDAVKEDDFPDMKRLMWCGEVLPVSVLRYWMQKLPHVTFTNLYGPTETTVASSYYTVPAIPDANETSVPIGTACGGERLYILDEALREMKTGEVGDLHISGSGVAKGYWEDPERTAAAFRDNPFDSGAHGILYKTGDRARRDSDGLVHFHGRTDRQIKSRGYRIELGEIESAIDSLGLTAECAVIALNDGAMGSTEIHCAYVPLEGAAPGSATLRKLLEAHLPGYMIPVRWSSWPILPRNGNGKIDRNRIQTELAQHETTTHR